MAAADLSNLVVEVLHNRGNDNHSDWSVGSGFFVGTNLVLTALHNVDRPGELLVRIHGTDEYPAVVRQQGDEDLIDLALLEVRNVEVAVPPLRYGMVDRRARAVVERCWTVGFPRFKERAHDPKPLRLSVQVDGEIPTGENLDQPLLTLQVRRSPRPLSSRAIRESEWAGMSGAVVFSDDDIIVGVVTEHHLQEGENALTVVPITALDLLPGTEAAKWWKLLRINHPELVHLPPDIFASYLRRLVYEYENWSEFNDVIESLPHPKKPMMIQKMASSDLYREFIPLGIQYMQFHHNRWETTSTGFVMDLKTTWLARSGPQAEASLLLILGDYGTGKSSYAIRLAYEVARSHLAHPMEAGHIPLYVDLRDYRRFGNIETFLAKLLRDVYQVHVESWRLRRLLEEGRLLLIFDGFDEMASRGSVNDTLANFREIKRLSLPGVKTVLTCRTHYFRSDREVGHIIDERSLSLDNPLLNALKQHSSYIVVNLQQFSDKQIRELIRHRVGNTQVDEIWSEISRRYNLLDLARRPVLLDMILSTMPTLVASGDKINAAHVYEAYTSLWIDRDDWRSNLTAEGKRELTKRLAWYMMKSWLSRSAETGQRTSFDIDNRDAYASISVHQLLQATGNVPHQWLKSLGASAEEADRLDYELRTCSFLRRDTVGRYSFSHRSFLEYFSALYLLDTADSPDSPLLWHRLATYSNAVSRNWPSPEVVAFMISILQNTPEKDLQVLSLTRRQAGSGGNGLTLLWEALRRLLPEDKIGHNLRDCVAYALDLSERDLTGTDLSCSALASPCLERTVLRNTKWESSACRINHVYEVIFGSDPSILRIGSANGMLSSWDLKNGTRLACLHLKTDYVFDMSIHEGANLWAYTTSDGWIHLCRAHDGSLLWSQHGEGAGSGKVALSHSGRYLVAGSWEGYVRIWNCSDGVEVGAWNMGKRVGCVVIDPSDQYVLVTEEENIHLLQIGGEERMLASGKEHESFEAAAFSPDGKLVALVGIAAIAPLRIIEVSTGETVFEIQGVYGHAMAFSPDGLQLAVGGGPTIIELPTRRQRIVMVDQPREIKALQFSLDGTRLISGGFDGSAQVWDAMSGALLTVVDVGINCFGADISGSVGFGESSFLLPADWEWWWSGAALYERLRRCGAIETACDKSNARYTQPTPRAVWDGTEYSAWRSGLKWVNAEEAYRIRHGKEMPRNFLQISRGVHDSSDFFPGTAMGSLW